MKFKLMTEYIDTLDDNDIVSLTPLDILEKRFRSIGAKIDVVNSGTYIGYVKDLKHMFQEICISNDCGDSKVDDHPQIKTFQALLNLLT